MKFLKYSLGVTIIRSALIITTMLSSISTQADDLQSLKNLERERSNMIEILLDENLEAEQRQARIESKVRRLVDLERMVMRDSRLEGNTHLLVQRTFKNYDLSFLAHASVESKQAVVGLWMNEIGLSDAAILASYIGVR